LPADRDVTARLVKFAPTSNADVPSEEYSLPSVRLTANSPAAIYDEFAALVVLGVRPDTDDLLI
jgi:hypothetical protein